MFDRGPNMGLLRYCEPSFEALLKCNVFKINTQRTKSHPARSVVRALIYHREEKKVQIINSL